MTPVTGFWSYLEARSDRTDRRRAKRVENRVARQLVLIDKGLDFRSLALRTFLALDPRLFIALSIISLFAAAFLRETDKDTRNLMVGALIAAFAGAWGYYLGSSSTASRANDRADDGLKLAHETLNRLAPPAGQSGLAGTVDVLGEDEKAEIERLIAENDLAALQALAIDIADAAGKTDPREIATLIVKARRA